MCGEASAHGVRHRPSDFFLPRKPRLVEPGLTKRERRPVLGPLCQKAMESVDDWDTKMEGLMRWSTKDLRRMYASELRCPEFQYAQEHRLQKLASCIHINLRGRQCPINVFPMWRFRGISYMYDEGNHHEVQGGRTEATKSYVVRVS